MLVLLGNTAAIESVPPPDVDGLTDADLKAALEAAGIVVDTDADRATLEALHEVIPRSRPIDGPQVTEFRYPDTWSRSDVLAAITSPQGAWARHSTADRPAWVEGDDDLIVELIADELGIPNGRPASWAGPAMTVSTMTMLSTWAYLIALTGIILGIAAQVGAFLKVNSGNDFQSRVMGDTASNGTGSYASATWVALTEDGTAPAGTDTTVAGELNAGGGGLNRKQAAYSHTTGAASYALTVTFTMNANDGSSRTVRKRGILNASTGGTLVFETLVPNPPTLVPDDQLVITDTVSI